MTTARVRRADLVNCIRCGTLHPELDDDGRFRDLCDWCSEQTAAVQEDLNELAAEEAAEPGGLD